MIDLNFITAILYLSSASLAWIASARPQTSPDGANSAPPDSAKLSHLKKAAVVLALGMVMHGVAIFWSVAGDDERGINMGFTHAISLIVWLTLLSYVLVGRDARLTRLAALYLAPIAALAASAVVWSPGKRWVDYGGMDAAATAHVVLAVLAYALFTVATLHSLLVLFLQRQLLAGTVSHSAQPLPPLMRIERLMFRLLTVAFALLTATLISGVFFSEALFGKAFEISHKTVFAVMSWFVFGGLVVGHWTFGWRGRLAVRWTLIGFAMLLLSYVGSKFVLEIILKRV
jgi:ABC-type uncharacterized transport system permease subunit